MRLRVSYNNRISTGAPPQITAATLTLTAASLGAAVPWTKGFAFNQGMIPTGNFIKAVSTAGAPLTSFQADVRNLWPDGSVKRAVLSGISNCGSAVSQTLTLSATGTAPVGSAVPEPSVGIFASMSIPRVVLTPNGVAFPLSSGGTFALSSLLGVAQGAWNAATPGRVRSIPGTVMSEFHYYQPTNDPLVSLWWYVRAYTNGAGGIGSVEVHVVCENSFWGVSGGSYATPKERDYTYSFFCSSNAVADFTQTVQHLARRRWEFIRWAGAAQWPVVPSHNVGFLCDFTFAVPRFTWRSPTVNSYNGNSTNGTPWVGAINPLPFTTQSNYTTPMTAAGYQPQTGVLPQWESVYCTAPVGDPANVKGKAYTATVGNMQLAGQFPVFIRDETTGRPINPSTYPTYGLDAAGFSGTQGVNVDGTAMSFGPSPLGGTGNQWNVPTHPSLGYLPYLIEGRWPWLEALQMAAALAIMSTASTLRQLGSTGTQALNLVVAPWAPPLTTAGGAWALRTVAQAAATVPRYFNSNAGAVLAADAALGTVLTNAVHDTAYFLDHAYRVGDIQLLVGSYVTWQVCLGGTTAFYNTVGYLGQYDFNETAVDDPKSIANGGNAGAYNAVYPYALNDYVISNGNLYQSSVAGNVGNAPSGTNAATQSWVYVVGQWNSGYGYNFGQAAIYQGYLYRAVATFATSNINLLPSGTAVSNDAWTYIGAFGGQLTDQPNDAWWGSDTTAMSMALTHAVDLVVEGLTNQLELTAVTAFSYQTSLQMMGSDGTSGALINGTNYRISGSPSYPLLTYPYVTAAGSPTGSAAQPTPFAQCPLPLLLPLERQQVYMNHFALPALGNNPGQTLCRRWGSTAVATSNDDTNVATGDWARQITVLGYAYNVGATNAAGIWDLIMRSPSVSSAYPVNPGNVANTCSPGPSDEPQWLFWPRTNGAGVNVNLPS